MEHIDLYYCHRVDQKTPIEKTIEAMVELKKFVSLLSAEWQPCQFKSWDCPGKKRESQDGANMYTERARSNILV